LKKEEVKNIDRKRGDQNKIFAEIAKIKKRKKERKKQGK
jgi:hypothetical protein